MSEIINNLKMFYHEQKKLKDRPQTTGEEVLNAVTHGTGVLLSSAALVIMVFTAAVNGKSASVITGLAIFGSTSIILYLMSALYHSLSKTKARDVF